MTAKCPKCNCNDRIQKVSSLYADRTKTYNISTGTNTGRITIESELANRLQPPTPPGGGIRKWYFLPIISITMLFAPIKLKYKLLIGICLCLALLDTTSFRTIGLIAAYTIYYMLAIREAREAEERITAKQMPYYIMKQIEWESSYYCHRDDVIFVP
jgi:hypothetical protein